jgi:hypothetical protein
VSPEELEAAVAKLWKIAAERGDLDRDEEKANADLLTRDGNKD